MAHAIHINGPCLAKVNTGNGGALEELGWGVDGFNLDFTFYDSPIIADTGGISLPVDLQDMLYDCNISGTLSVYDSTVLAKVLKRADAVAFGTMPTPGSLIFGTGGLRLLLTSPSDEPFNFLNACYRNRYGLKIGTKQTTPHVNFYALPLIGTASSGKDKVLFNRVTT